MVVEGGRRVTVTDRNVIVWHSNGGHTTVGNTPGRDFDAETAQVPREHEQHHGVRPGRGNLPSPGPEHPRGLQTRGTRLRRLVHAARSDEPVHDRSRRGRTT
jgi:hypothetical protein